MWFAWNSETALHSDSSEKIQSPWVLVSVLYTGHKPKGHCGVSKQFSGCRTENELWEDGWVKATKAPDMLHQSLLLPLCSLLSTGVSLVQTQSRHTCLLPRSSSATGAVLSLHMLFPGPIIPPERKAVLWVTSLPFQHWGEMVNSLVMKEVGRPP